MLVVFFNFSHFFKSVRDLGGGSLLKMYKDSLSHTLQDVYPENEWLPWKFRVTPSSYWDDIANQKEFMTWAEKQLNIRELSDWYKVSATVTMATYSSVENKGLCFFE
jgi:hypothetical protein